MIGAAWFIGLLVGFMGYTLAVVTSLTRKPGLFRPIGGRAFPPPRPASALRAIAAPQTARFRPEARAPSLAPVRGEERIAPGAVCWRCGGPLAVGDHSHGG